MNKHHFLIIFFISLFVLSANAQNLVVNGDFNSGISPWSISLSEGAAGTFNIIQEAENNIGKVNSNTLGSVSHNIQLLQQNITLLQNTWYHLTFRAKTSLSGNQTKVSLGLNVTPYSTYFSNTFTLSTSWQTYNLSFFTAATWFPVSSPFNHQLAIQCGINLGELYIDDIQIIKPTVTNTNTALAFVPRTNFPNSRFDPKDVVLHGAGQSDFNSFNNYQNALSTSHAPMVFMPYYGISDLKATWGIDLKNSLENYPQWILPQIGLDLIVNNAPCTDDINNGKYDTQIDYLVQGIKDLNRPVYLRIGYECNGSHNAYVPVSYKNAFIRITNKLRTANIEAATVWNLVVSGITSGTTISDFYPGDQYVDWVALNLFSTSDIGNSACTTILNFAKSKNKPVLIGESTPRYVGVLDGQNSWDTWFYKYFKFIADNPSIKMFCYINWNWANYTQWANWGNAQIQDNWLVAANYNEEMNSNLYYHGASESVTRSILSKASTPVKPIVIPKLNVICRDGLLFFAGFEKDNSIVEIYNLSGTMLKNFKLSCESISVADLNKGLYILQIKGNRSSLIQVL